ncbi:hypothetical protein [Flavobacterium crassostreae]|uniref:hypothetical protein n=1 Tax=Flavobacterium crassostreae TaxID=1763534 RepID=UPI00159EE6F5|nr:hypothetical protein [Flavobacterium crassostreae]
MRQQKQIQKPLKLHHMRAIERITRAVRFLKKLKSPKNLITSSVEDLVHPRFGMNPSDLKQLHKVPNSLQFLMYSKENDTLFI